MKEHAKAKREEESDHNRSRSTSTALPQTVRTWFNTQNGKKTESWTGCVIVLAIAEERKKYIRNRRGELASNATHCNTEGVGGTEELAVAKSRIDQTRTST